MGGRGEGGRRGGGGEGGGYHARSHALAARGWGEGGGDMRGEGKE